LHLHSLATPSAFWWIYNLVHLIPCNAFNAHSVQKIVLLHILQYIMDVAQVLVIKF